MLWVPKKGILRVESNLTGVGEVNPGTSITSGAANTKGAYSQLIAATAFDAYMVGICGSNWAVTATRAEAAMDIAIGAATEEIIIPDLLVGNANGWGETNGSCGGGKFWLFPLYIPAGSRLTARVAHTVASSVARCQIWLFGGDGCPPFRVGSKVTTYGISGTPGIGTAITPGASGAEGSWTQIVASTTEDHFAFAPSFQFGNDTTTNLRSAKVDIGIGAATEEEIGQWMCGMDSNERMGSFFPPMCAFADVPSGTRLAMRASNSGTNDGAYNGAIHAVS